MPSNSQRVTAALVTAALFLGGAWVASGFRQDLYDTSASSTGTASDTGVIVSLHGARSDTGNLVVMAYDQATAFDLMSYTQAAGYVATPATPHPARVDFPDLTSGNYALIAFHDENANGQLDLDENMIPTEGYAISGMNDLNANPVFEYSLISPGWPVDMVFFYWQPAS